jgi:hypothetical protein
MTRKMRSFGTQKSGKTGLDKSLDDFALDCEIFASMRSTNHPDLWDHLERMEKRITEIRGLQNTDFAKGDP